MGVSRAGKVKCDERPVIVASRAGFGANAEAMQACDPGSRFRRVFRLLFVL